MTLHEMHLARVREAYREAYDILIKYLGATHPVLLELDKVRKRCQVQDELEPSI